MSKFPPALIGVLCAVSGAILFGTSLPLRKLLLADIEPWMLTALLTLAAGLGTGLLFWGRRSKTTSRIQGKDWFWLVCMVFAGGISAPLLLILGLSSNGSAASASLWLNLEAVFTALIAWVLFRERFGWRVGVGIGLISLGGVVLSLEAGVGLSWAALAMIGSALFWAIDTNLNLHIAHRDPLQVIPLRNTIAGGLLLAMALGVGDPLPAWDHLFQTGVLGLTTQGFGSLLFLIGIRYIGASQASAYLALAPFIGSVISVVAFHEPLSGYLVTAAVLMGVGVGYCLHEQLRPKLLELDSTY